MTKTRLDGERRQVLGRRLKELTPAAYVRGTGRNMDAFNYRKTGQTVRVVKRFFAALVVVAMTVCNVAPLSVWAAVEETEERKAFFSVSEDVIDALGAQIEAAYDERSALIENYVFTADQTTPIYGAGDTDTSVETYIHDFKLNPSEFETIIAIDTYFCQEDPQIEIRISVDADDTEGEGSDQLTTGLAWVTQNGDVAIDELKDAVIRNGDELTYVIELDGQELESLSYYVDEVGKNHILRFADSDVDINCVSIKFSDNCYGTVRGMFDAADYIDPSVALYDEQPAGRMWTAVISATNEGSQVRLAGTEHVELAWKNDDYDFEYADGIDESSLAMLAACLDGVYGETEDPIIDITEGASMLYLDSYVFIDPEEIKTYSQKVTDLYYDAQINVYGVPMYVTSTPDTLGSAQEYLGNSFDASMTDGTVGIKVVKPADDLTAGKLVLELPESTQLRFTKGDGTGFEFNVDDVVNGLVDTKSKAGDDAKTSDAGTAVATALEMSVSAAEDAVFGTSASEVETTSVDASISENEAATSETSVPATEIIDVDASAAVPAEETMAAEAIAVDVTENTEKAAIERDSSISTTALNIDSTELEVQSEADTDAGMDATEEENQNTGMIDNAQITAETDADGDYVQVIENSGASDIIAEIMAREAREEAGSEAKTESNSDTELASDEADDEELIPVGIVLSHKFLKRASYCAVADDMTICAVYDENGRLTALADGYTEDDIAAYILLPAAEDDVRVERIDFVYSDVVADAVGQEYGELILSEDTEAAAVVNQYIDSQTKFEENIDINGITDDDGSDLADQDGDVAGKGTGDAAASGAGTGDASTGDVSTGDVSTGTKTSDSTETTGDAAGSGTADAGTAGTDVASGTTGPSGTAESAGGQTGVTVHESTAQESIAKESTATEGAAESTTTAGTAAESSTTADITAGSETVYAGGPGETADTGVQTQPDVLPETNLPAEQHQDMHTGTSDYGDYYPGEDDGDGDTDGSSDDDSSAGSGASDHDIDGAGVAEIAVDDATGYSDDGSDAAVDYDNSAADADGYTDAIPDSSDDDFEDVELSTGN